MNIIPIQIESPTMESNNEDSSLECCDRGMPRWTDDCTIDKVWIERITGIESWSCSVQDISNQTRRGKVIRDGCTLLLSITKTCDSKRKHKVSPPRYLVIKQITLGKDGADSQRRALLSRQLGLGREAYFYRDLAPQLSVLHVECGIPRIYYSYANSENGEKCIILEYLDSSIWLDSGIFFGPGNPNNWNRNLGGILQAAYDQNNTISSSIKLPPTSAEVAKKTFQYIARIHGYFWKQTSLLDEEYNWLRGHGWIQQRDRESWEASQKLIQTIWSNYVESEKLQQSISSCTDKDSDSNNVDTGKKNKIQWDPLVRSLVEKSVSCISWENQINRLNVSCHWTLVHGDFWPGNVMWHIYNSSDHNNNDAEGNNNEVCLIDWEMVGLGSGPQDLGQYILSNMNASERRECEHDLIKIYYDELVKTNTVLHSHAELHDYCWKEYTIGGIERWIWFLIWFIGQEDNEALSGWAQFFHDQICDFTKDHNISVSDISQPRP